MQSRQRGFTLIELLIVIAIIGILAAMLAPKLLSARTSAGKRAVQVHSGNVYEALQAALVDDPAKTVGDILTDAGPSCMTAHSIGTSGYGWRDAPGGAASCAISGNGATPGSSTDFKVEVTANAATGGLTSTDGRDLR